MPLIPSKFILQRLKDDIADIDKELVSMDQLDEKLVFLRYLYFSLCGIFCFHYKVPLQC